MFFSRFVKRTIQSPSLKQDRKLSHRTLKVIDHNIQPESRRHSVTSDKQPNIIHSPLCKIHVPFCTDGCQQSQTNIVWKDFILNR